MEFLRTLLDALKLSLFVRPARPARRIGPGQYWLALGVATLLLALESRLDVDGPARFFLGGLTGIAFTGLLALGVSYLAARALGEVGRQPGWRFCVVDRYDLSGSKDALTGKYHSSGCNDNAAMTLTRSN